MSNAEFLDIERDETLVEETEFGAPPCEQCGEPTPYSYSTTDQRLCRFCADRRDAEYAARRTPAPAKSAADLVADYQAIAAEMIEKFKRSPHVCACGEKVLSPGLCGECQSKERIWTTRRAQAEMSLYAIPNRYKWAKFDSPDLQSRVKDAQAIEKARGAAVAGIDRVVFVGPAGHGKTVLACCMMTALVIEYETVFVSALDLSVARAHEGLGRGEASLVAKAMSVGLLVLDDLGADKLIQQSAVPDVIHERHAEMRPTIITTGFQPEAIAAKYGDGVARRVFEKALVITLKAPKVLT